MPVRVYLSPKVEDPMSGWRLAQNETPLDNTYRAVIVVDSKDSKDSFRLLSGWWHTQYSETDFWEVDTPFGTSEDQFKVLMWHDGSWPLYLDAVYTALEGIDAPSYTSVVGGKCAKFDEPHEAASKIAELIALVKDGVAI